MTGDVFEEDPAQAVAKLSDDAGDVGPEVARIVCPESLPGLAERLTRVASQQGVDRTCKWPGVKGCEIVPDRGRGKVSGPLGCDDG